MYYIYHIPGKKIGVTCDLNNRVTKQQGYKPSEYEVLEQSEDIDYISKKEIELQKAHGYKVDRKLYKNLKPQTNMKINVTEQTTTFPCPINKLKGQLMDNIGMSWETEHGELNIYPSTIGWIMKNVKTSMYNDNRCYVYNKAFARLYDNNDMFILESTNDKPTDERFDLIRDWAAKRGLYTEGNSHTQFVKLMEESGELAKALLTDDKPEIIDAIGDIVVVLTNLAHLQGFEIEHCIDEAYSVIAARTGKMINGTFVKDE